MPMHMVENYLIGVLAYTCIEMRNLEKVPEKSFPCLRKEKKPKSILHLAYLKDLLNAIAHHPSKAWFSVKEKAILHTNY